MKVLKLDSGEAGYIIVPATAKVTLETTPIVQKDSKFLMVVVK